MAAQLGELPHPSGGYHAPDQGQFLQQGLAVQLPEVRALRDPFRFGGWHGPLDQRELPGGRAVIGQGGVEEVHAQIGEQSYVGCVGDPRGVDELGPPDPLPEIHQGLHEGPGVAAELEGAIEHGHLLPFGRGRQAALPHSVARPERGEQAVALHPQDRLPVHLQEHAFLGRTQAQAFRSHIRPEASGGLGLGAVHGPEAAAGGARPGQQFQHVTVNGLPIKKGW
ncbi:MAG: hypothetical protein A4E29_00497 [Methanomassiliicoccales archaeon PtaB.Bin134]|nr:MAG: hypothetical protein A4E29_00497 [Methanomassiliicoccales archaeon PtaB.Bin134]